MKKQCIINWLILTIGAFYSYAHANSTETSLGFSIRGNQIKNITLSELSSNLSLHKITLFNPHMNKQKTYEAFAIKDVLNFAYQNDWASDQYSDIAFTALDGYEAVSSLGKFQETGGFLAYRDLDVESGWELIGRKQANPGPFFLVWIEEHQNTANAYPWPWQVASLNLLSFEEQYPKIVPAGASKKSGIYQGFKIFRSRCLRCHAMDQQGGKIGPDLNAPKNITTYRSKHMIKEMIKHPSQYRHTHMPDHTDLSDNDLEHLYDYLLFQKKN